MRVDLESLTKKWGDVVGAEEVSLSIDDGEFVAFLGPSGCGKTTTLLMIAGIYRPTAGQVLFDGQVVNRMPPKDRNIGMVFQSYALYPHMTVYQNISYPLKLQKVPRESMRQQVQTVADLMGIGHLLERKPAELSGGQQQRVALGRALVKKPGLLLFDEPLSNLDARLRMSMRSEIKRLQLELDITSIYVTHDQVEAMTMADRIAVMNEGRLQAFCTPEELYDRPRTAVIGGFVGNPPMNLFDVEVGFDDGRYHARREGIDVVVSPDRGAPAAGCGRVQFGVRAEDVALGSSGIPGEVYVVEPMGRDHLIDVLVGDVHIQVLVNPATALKVGDLVQLSINPDKVQFFDIEDGQSLLWSG